MKHCYCIVCTIALLRKEEAEEVKHIYKVKGTKIPVDKSVNNL